ncbi:MAG: hypothetical protein EPN24_02235 [Candidatus Methanoperedens sp.]|nr:MAG: hypothetical protein EPN24_02235 [Candidatus Methanoperedens sp.]
MNGTVKKKELHRDRHTVSLLTDHLVFSPKYRGKVLVGDVAMVAESISGCRDALAKSIFRTGFFTNKSLLHEDGALFTGDAVTPVKELPGEKQIFY